MKKGTQVEFTRRNGERAVGRYNGVTKRANGSWAEVNLAPKGRPAQVALVRPSQLAPV